MPFEDLEYLTQQNAIRTNGSATAGEAASANQWVAKAPNARSHYVPEVDHWRIYVERELLDYLAKLADMRAAEPKDDIISSLVVQMEAGNLEKPDVVQIAFLLLVAGNATMVNMIALVSWYAKLALHETWFAEGLG